MSAAGQPANLDPVIEISPVLRAKALAAGQDEWLEGLADLIVELSAEWRFRPGRRLDGATESYVTAVTLDHGSEAVLKLLVPGRGPAAAHEATVLRLADGNGCARLLREDSQRNALLLERLGPPMSTLGLALEDRHRILAGLAAALWRPAPGSGLPGGDEKGRGLIEYITRLWEDLDRPCSERAVAYALACAERRVAAHEPERAVLVHGDIHQWNALRAGERFKLIDPDGLLAEPAYDLGIIMREDPVELLDGDPRQRARMLAALTGLDAQAIWEWGAVERVSTGLLCTQIGLQPVGRDMLIAAEHVAD